jgi:hypothetical protein
MIHDKNKASLLILAGMKKPKKGGEPEEEEVEESGDEGLVSAMEDLGTALDAKDWKAAASAFKAAKELCADYEEEDEAEDDEESEFS